MKVCPVCGDTYRDHVDFCFSDGAILSLAEADVAGDRAQSELDAPLPRLVQGGQTVTTSDSTSETMPLPRPVRAAAATVPATVPTANAPDDDDGVAMDGGSAELEVDSEGDGDPEVTAIRMDEPDLGGEPTEVDARTTPPARTTSGPRISARTGADTLPLVDVDSSESEPQEPMRVAPLTEAETTPFVRRAPGDDTPVSSPRAGVRANNAPTQLNLLQAPPKRRQTEEQDRSRFLWVGAIVVGVVVAVAFVASMAMLVLIVGVGQGIDDGDQQVAIAPRSPPVPAMRATPEPEPMPGPEPEPVGAPDPIDDPLEVATVEPPAPEPTPVPSAAPQPAVQAPDNSADDPPPITTLSFDLRPPEAEVWLDDRRIALVGGRWQVPDPTRSYRFDVRDGTCRTGASWSPGRSTTLEVRVAPCAPPTTAMVFWRDDANVMTHVTLDPTTSPQSLPARLQFRSPGTHRAWFSNKSTGASDVVDLVVPSSGENTMPVGNILIKVVPVQ